MRNNFIFALLLFCSLESSATHLRGGEITIARTSGSANSYLIILTIYAHEAAVKPGGGTLDFGDGSQTYIPGPPNPPIINPTGALFWSIKFPVNHTFPGPGFYRVTYIEQNLDAEIVNMSNSVDTPMFLESGFVIDPLVNFTPLEFASDPIQEFETGKPFSFSSAPVDTTSAIYNYELVVPEKVAGVSVSNYIFPENLQINSQTGLLTWDAKFQHENKNGEYLVSILVTHFDKKKNYLGYVKRVFTIFLQQPPSEFSMTNPISDPLGKVLVAPGNQKKIKVILSDTISMDTVFWTPYFDQAMANYISFSQYDSTTATKKIKVGLLVLQSASEIARELPYEIILRGTSVFSGLPQEITLSSLKKDFSFLFFTKDVDLPVVTSVIPSDPEISAYPNPFTNELHFSGISSGKVQLVNTMGQLVSQSLINSDKSLDTSTLQPGVYIVILNEGNRRSQFKVMKK